LVSIGNESGKFNLVRLIPEPSAWTDAFWLPAGIFGGIFLSMASHGSDQMMVQRYLCAKSQNAAAVALVGSGVVVFLQFALFLIIGAGLFALQQSGTWSPEGNILPDRIIGRYVVERLPAGMAGLVVAAVLAAAMSTLSSSLNSSASAFIGDFVKLWFPKITGEQELVTGRWASGVFGLLQMMVAWTAWQAGSEKGVIEQIFTIAGFLAGLVLGLFLLGIRKRVVRSPSALGGMVLGGALVLYFWLPTLWGEKGLAWPWYAPLGTLSTLGFGLLLDLPSPKRKIQPGNS
jgi:Na+/proline symporter